MIVLGITETHCATAAILRDGAIVGCASEERFTRLKNDAGYPRLAVDALLRELSLTPRDIDLVALAGTRAYARDWMNRVLHDADYAREYYGVRLEERARGLGRRARKLGARLGLAERSRGKFELTERQRLALVTDHLGLERSRIVAYDHHLCHAAAAYYGSPFAGERALVLTNDNAGDGLCATVSTGRGTALVRHEAVPSAPGSLGSFYSFVTLLLGMKFGEHEYKVMGLAPYAPARQAERAHEALSAVFGLEATTPARFAWKRRGPRHRLLLETTLGLRFDAVAAGAPPVGGDSLLAGGRALRARPRGGRPADRGGLAAGVGAAHARASRRRAAGAGRRRLHEREGQRAHRRGAVAAGSLRVPVVRRRVQRDRRRLPRLAGARQRRSDAPALRPRLPGAVDRPGERRDPDPLARPRVQVSRDRARADRGAHRRAPGGGWRGGALRRADGGRRARARQPVDPRQSLGSPGGRDHQSDDQEPRLLDAVRPVDPA